MLGCVWLFLCFLIMANNFIDNPFAEGSYSITTWTLVLSVVALLVIDLTVASGRDTAFVTGGVIGFALSAWYTFLRDNVGHNPIDVSMFFWLMALLGVAGYLLSALAAKNR